MQANSKDRTYYDSSNLAPEEEITPVERAIFDRVMLLSFEHDEKYPRKHKGLQERFRKLIVNMKMTKSSQKCSICLSEFCQGQIIKKFPCKHIFHRQCAKEWLKGSKNCPNCRFNIQEHFQNLQRVGKLAPMTKKEGQKNNEKSQQLKEKQEQIYQSQIVA